MITLGTKQYVDHGRPLEGKIGHLPTWNPGLSLLNKGYVGLDIENIMYTVYPFPASRKLSTDTIGHVVVVYPLP